MRTVGVPAVSATVVLPDVAASDAPAGVARPFTTNAMSAVLFVMVRVLAVVAVTLRIMSPPHSNVLAAESVDTSLTPTRSPSTMLRAAVAVASVRFSSQQGTVKLRIVFIGSTPYVDMLQVKALTLNPHHIVSPASDWMRYNPRT